MFALLRTATLMTLVVSAAGASAQQTSQPQAETTFSLPFGGVPAEIFGAPCKATSGDANFAPSLRCELPNFVERPSILVSVADWRGEPSQAEMIANVREAFHERSMFNVVHESRFAPPSDPTAVGFHAIYQTELGNRYVWAVRSKGKMVKVIATVFSPIDANDMITEIEWKVFGVPLP